MEGDAAARRCGVSGPYVEAAVYYLHQNRPPGDVYYVVGTESFRRQLAVGVALRNGPVDGVTAALVGFDTELTCQKIEDACRPLARGADFLVANPNLACPTQFGSIPDCGSICQLRAARDKSKTFKSKEEADL